MCELIKCCKGTILSVDAIRFCGLWEKAGILSVVFAFGSVNLIEFRYLVNFDCAFFKLLTFHFKCRVSYLQFCILNLF